MSTKHNLTWSDRFALIDHYNPSDKQIVAALQVSQAELDTARHMRHSGSLIPSKDLDVLAYSTLFNVAELPTLTSDSVSSTKKDGKASKASAKTSTKVNQEDGDAQTATKRVASTASKKRGRKGTKIDEAFRAIPMVATPAEEFSQKWGVSIPVLRQSKRFDSTKERGIVRVKMNKATGVLEIWREAPAAQTSSPTS